LQPSSQQQGAKIETMPLDNPAVLQFIKYALAGGLATLTHIIIFHFIAWKIFPLPAGEGSCGSLFPSEDPGN
jgi:hypothetical protein